MNAKKMVKLCGVALQKLDDLESLLAYIPIEQEADRFVYASMNAVKELRGIAQWETTHNVTTEQAGHIKQILGRIGTFMDLVHNSAKRALDDDKDRG
jgi:hypothetical protein